MARHIDRRILAWLGGSLLPIAAISAQDPLLERVQWALKKARPELLSMLAAATKVGEPGHLGLLCLAALHDGVADDDPVLAAAIAKLAAAKTNATYALALRLLVAEACASYPERAGAAAADAAALLKNREDGGFAYTPDSPEWDLSNTQYAALGLRAAAALGVKIDRSVWTKLADAVIDLQRGSGGFVYRPAVALETPSMTAAGIAVLSICRQALDQKGRTVPEIDRRLQHAWRWFEKHVDAIGSESVPWSYYFHYGLERAAILGDVVTIGSVDWYRRGAQMFTESQLPAGRWKGSSQDEAVETAFAVLFLRRRFQKIAAPATAARTIVLDALGPQSTKEDIAACVDGLVRRGKTAVTDILVALRGEEVMRRRAAVRALATIAGIDFGIDPEAAPTANEQALRRAELWYLKNR